MTYFLESGIVISETRKTNNTKMEETKMRKAIKVEDLVEKIVSICDEIEALNDGDK